ncbi:MAG: hypothetical protein NTU49_00650 [Gammaproteobacteria bacterium]|nr:hypothetical protein [Gammaproteobacteria bacterium]
MKYSIDLLNIKRRLTEWGHWCYQITTIGLGHSHRSLIAKLEEEGDLIIQGTAKMLVPTNEQAEEINHLIEQLAEQKPQGAGKPEWAKIIRIHYTMQNKEIAERIQSAALTKRTYYRYLHDGEEWLSQYL